MGRDPSRSVATKLSYLKDLDGVRAYGLLLRVARQLLRPCRRVVQHPGVHVLDVARVFNGDDAGRLRLVVETERGVVGCPTCGQLAVPHGRRRDIPAFGQPVRLVWRVRRYRCADVGCRQVAFTEDHDLAPPRV